VAGRSTLIPPETEGETRMRLPDEMAAVLRLQGLGQVR
jgi:hypothetical protein